MIEEEPTAPAFSERYPSLGHTPHRWRSRRANAIAALALIGAIIVVIALLALT